MELTSAPHTSARRPIPAFAQVFRCICSLFFFSLSLSFCSAALPPHVNPVYPPPPLATILLSACPPRCVAPPSLAILCVLIKNATLFTFHFFCVPNGAQGSHCSELYNSHMVAIKKSASRHGENVLHTFPLRGRVLLRLSRFFANPSDKRAVTPTQIL